MCIAFLCLFCGDALSECKNYSIPDKIEEYISEHLHLRAKINIGKWVALDFVIDERDLRDAYSCISDEMLSAYKNSKLNITYKYRNWLRVNNISVYAPANDFGWANVFVNKPAEKYSENVFNSQFAAGSVIVKESFIFDVNGDISIGPLFYMEKMQKEFNPNSGDWKFVEVNVDGSYSETNGMGSETTVNCIECHSRRKDTDYLFFLSSK